MILTIFNKIINKKKKKKLNYKKMIKAYRISVFKDLKDKISLYTIKKFLRKINNHSKLFKNLIFKVAKPCLKTKALTLAEILIYKSKSIQQTTKNLLKMNLV